MKIQYETELYHFGIKGMKWYRRRYQEEDGSLTPAGRARYADQQAKQSARVDKYEAKAAKYNARAAKKEAGFVSKRQDIHDVGRKRRCHRSPLHFCGNEEVHGHDRQLFREPRHQEG